MTTKSVNLQVYKSLPNKRRIYMVKISDAEWKIMNLLWEEEPKTIMQITKELKDITGWSKHTIITYLKRMEAKGIIYHEEGDKAKLYYTCLDRGVAVLQEKESFLSKVFKVNAGLIISTMVEQNELSDQDIDQLIELLKSKK